VLVQPITEGSGRGGAAVYAAAGLMGPVGGLVVCSLDAGTGKPRWETRLGDGPDNIYSASGQMAWYDRKVWLTTGENGVLIIDSQTGKTTPAIDFDKYATKLWSSASSRWGTCSRSRGQDIGIFPGGWVVVGGRSFYMPQHWYDQSRNKSAFLQAAPDALLKNAAGYPNVLELSQAAGCGWIPVWDAKGALLSGGDGGRQPPPMLCNGLGDALVTELAAHPFNPVKANYGGLRNEIPSDLAAHRQAWALPAELKKCNGFMTPVMSGNAVIFFTREGSLTDWHVVAVSRSDSSLLWDLHVPAQPMPGALSVTSAGDVLAPLVDGRVVCIGTP